METRKMEPNPRAKERSGGLPEGPSGEWRAAGIALLHKEPPLRKGSIQVVP